MSEGTRLILEQREAREGDLVDLAPPEGIVVLDAVDWLAPHLGSMSTETEKDGRGKVRRVTAHRKSEREEWKVEILADRTARILRERGEQTDLLASLITTRGWRRARERKEWIRAISAYVNKRLWSARVVDPWAPGKELEWSGGHLDRESALEAARIGFRHEWDTVWAIDRRGNAHVLKTTNNQPKGKTDER
jgi:uncharacterized protein YnzC (UPF0291/DUF896 family)